jgi:pimeloyl-ACP methyl ester carboxylesterase
MKLITQSSFKAPHDQSSVANESLIIHTHQDRADNHNLIIFVHGLGGSRYGTWGLFPELIFANFPHVEVGLHSYRTLFRRYKLWRSISLDEEAAVLGDQIRDDLTDYQTVILFGHSMGGLLCMASIAYLASSNQKEALNRIGGLILAGTPQTGSLKIPWLATWLSLDFRALKAHGQFVTNTLISIKNHVTLDTDGLSSASRVVIPTRAMFGVLDLWVDPLSARINLPDARVRRLNLSHTQIVKAVSTDSENYKYAAFCLQKCLDRPVIHRPLISNGSKDISPEEPDPNQSGLPGPADNPPAWVQEAVTQAEEATSRGEDVFFGGDENSGKTTALMEFLARSRKAGKRTVLVHLSAFSNESLRSESLFLLAIADKIYSDLMSTTKLRSIEKPPKIRDAQQFIHYVYDELPDALYPLVIGVEEVGRIRHRHIEDSFHRMIRALREQDKFKAKTRKVQFALCGIERAEALSKPDRGESKRVHVKDIRLFRNRNV